MERESKFSKRLTNSPVLLNQRTARSEARRRRIGRGRKRMVALPSYRINHTNVFGDTDIFKNLADKGG